MCSLTSKKDVWLSLVMNHSTATLTSISPDCERTEKIGLGGGCHWCTEGVFASLLGVIKVNQGWIASVEENANFSEAIEVNFDPKIISLETLIHIHLLTHAATSAHSMRGKYRSAVYVYSDSQSELARNILDTLQQNFDQPLVTEVYPFSKFKPNSEELKDYFYTEPNRPFCQTYIQPKLKRLMAEYSQHLNTEKLRQAKIDL